MAAPLPDAASIRALAGHCFAGGNYTVEHWENVLLTGCTGAELLPQGMAHPIALFHLPISGAGTSGGRASSQTRIAPGATHPPCSAEVTACSPSP